MTRPSPGGRARVHRVPRGGAGGLSGPLNSVTLAVSADGPVARRPACRTGLGVAGGPEPSVLQAGQSHGVSRVSLERYTNVTPRDATATFRPDDL